MDNSYRWLKLRQADQQLKPLIKKTFPPRPPCGWIQTIREALGMTAVSLAKRLHVRNSTIHKLEKNEADDSITLASLRKVAAALDCELHYFLVPKTPLETRLKNQAKAIAQQHQRSVSHTMSLEDQAISSRAQQDQVELTAKELLDSNWRELW